MAAAHDLAIRNGTIYDGRGGEPVAGDVAIDGDRVVSVGPVARGRVELDASGCAVTPGFVNMLSHAWGSLLVDGRSQSDIRQGVTLEVFGEVSMGPLNEKMKRDRLERQGDIKFDIAWTTLGEYLAHLESRGIACNVASFVSATTIRVHELDATDRAPTEAELARMCELVRQAMREGALGVASALIYTPATFARTDELIALARAAGELGGIYISHIRDEGPRLLEAIEEVVTIAREAGVAAEIYHLKQAGRESWHKLDAALAAIEAARAAGLRIGADMYPYTAGATGLDAAMPPWVQAGGHRAWLTRLRDTSIRPRVVADMRAAGTGWENMLAAAGTPENVVFSSFKSERLKPLTGRTLAQVAADRGTSPEDTIIDLVVEDDSRVGAFYFTVSEENLRRQIAQPWITFGSDAASLAPEGVFLRSNPHPRAYGAFARLLGHYVRDEGLIPIAEAVRRLTSLPAANLGLRRRGTLAPGFHADVAVFDPRAIRDHATYAAPHRYATGSRHVVVNGVPVLRDGEHTGALPGRAVWGPGRA